MFKAIFLKYYFFNNSWVGPHGFGEHINERTNQKFMDVDLHRNGDSGKKAPLPLAIHRSYLLDLSQIYNFVVKAFAAADSESAPSPYEFSL